MKKTILAFVVLVFGSCTREADIELPEQEEKLVVTCFISPDEEMITAVVRTSHPKFSIYNSSGKLEELKDAVVVIGKDGQEMTIPYSDSLGCYALSTSSFPVLPGVTYGLVVKTADGKSTSANTTVPADTLRFKSADLAMHYDANSENMDISYSAEAEDQPGQANFVALYHRLTVILPDTFFKPYEDYFDPGTGTFEDDEKTARTGYSFHDRRNYMGSGYNWDSTEVILEVWALNCSKEFYLYNRSAQTASYSGEDPFGDPVMVYTNMSNGFGCFGAYRKSVRNLTR